MFLTSYIFHQVNINTDSLTIDTFQCFSCGVSQLTWNCLFGRPIPNFCTSTSTSSNSNQEYTNSVSDPVGRLSPLTADLDHLQMQIPQFQSIGLEYSTIVQNVYKEEVSNCKTKESHKLLMSVHALFLESGFVCFDTSTQKMISRFHLPLGSNSKSTVTVHYILPNVSSEILGLKFQSMGNYEYVHGSLSNNNPVCFLRFDASRYVPSINYICTPSDEIDKQSISFHERELFELWRTGKDGLVLPLLIELCHRTGLNPPPCFTSLLTDLKMKILEFLPGTDIGRVSCVSLELKYLSSNNDMWKKKYIEEYSQSEYKETGKDDWKDNYITTRKRLMDEKIFRRLWGQSHLPDFRTGNFNGANIQVPACVIRSCVRNA